MPACPQTTSLQNFCVGGQLSPTSCDPEVAPDVRVTLRLVNASGAPIGAGTQLFDANTGIEYHPVVDTQDHLASDGCWCICVPFANYSSVDANNAISPTGTWWEIQLQVGVAAENLWSVVGSSRRFQIDADYDYSTSGDNYPIVGACGDCIPIQYALDPAGSVPATAGGAFCDAVMGCVQPGLDSLQAQIDALGPSTVDTASIEAAIAALQDRVTTVEGDVLIIQGDTGDTTNIDANSAAVAALQAEVASVQAALSALEAQVAAINVAPSVFDVDADGIISHDDGQGATGSWSLCDLINANCPSTVVADTAAGTVTVTGSDGSTVTFVAAEPGSERPDLSVTKQATNPGPFVEGQQAEFQILLTNNGDGTATNISVTDADADVLNVLSPIPDIPPGVGVSVGTATRTITAADVAAGSYSNTATVTYEGLDGATFSAQGSGSVATASSGGGGTGGGTGGGGGFFEGPPIPNITITELSSGPYSAGDVISIDVQVSNGGDPATSTASPSLGGNPTATGGVWSPPSVVGDNALETVTYTIPATANPGDTIEVFWDVWMDNAGGMGSSSSNNLTITIA